ncbi:hypothetical protein ASD16_17890 [Cellulomonas sp. Root485]|nr:hypothetical protein ASD16_17890 [Cellulomonas sp. Root485]
MLDSAWAIGRLRSAFADASGKDIRYKREPDENPEGIDEKTGREYLATLSVLARWVDDKEVETSP